MAGVHLTRQFNYSVQDTSTNGPTEICSSKGIVRGVYVNTTLSAHTVVIKDGTTAMFTIPANAGAGSTFDLLDTQFSSLNIDPDDSSTGNVTVIYAPEYSG